MLERVKLLIDDLVNMTETIVELEATGKPEVAVNLKEALLDHCESTMRLRDQAEDVRQFFCMEMGRGGEKDKYDDRKPKKTMERIKKLREYEAWIAKDFD